MAGSRIRHLESATDRTAGGIPYRLLEGYPKMVGGDDGQTATEKYLLLSSSASAFYAESFPPPVLRIGSAFLPPRRRMPGTNFLITKQIEFAPQSETMVWAPFGASRTGYDPYCVATITYEAMQEESIFERSVTAGMQFLSIPAARTSIRDEDVNGLPGESYAGVDPDNPSAETLDPKLNTKLLFTSKGAADLRRDRVSPSSSVMREDNLDAQTPILMHVPTCEWALRWKLVPNPNFAWYVYHLGRVNSDSPAILGGPSPETCLFAGFSAQQRFVWSGGSVFSQPWTVEFKFSQRQVPSQGPVYGWNHVYHSIKGRWVRVLRPDGTWMHPTFSVTNFING